MGRRKRIRKEKEGATDDKSLLKTPHASPHVE